jgi:hypothetical protein
MVQGASAKYKAIGPALKHVLESLWKIVDPWADASKPMVESNNHCPLRVQTKQAGEPYGLPGGC